MQSVVGDFLHSSTNPVGLVVVIIGIETECESGVVESDLVNMFFCSYCKMMS